MITYLNIQDRLIKNNLYCDTPVYSRKGRYRKLCTEVTFVLGTGQYMTIKPGFTWDENSIPWVLQPFFPKSGMYAASALVHDALYYLTAHSRIWVEDEFRRWMRATGIPRNQIFFRYWAVRLFGWRWWNRNKNSPSDRCIHNRKLIMLH